MTSPDVPDEPFTDVASYEARGSFCGVPSRRYDRVQAGDVVILGAAFDWGATHRPGSRFGPKAIREADYLDPDGRRPHLTAEIDPLVHLPVVDAGDIPLRGPHIEESIRAIEERVRTVSSRGGTPIVLGGDHTITYPDATGVAHHHGFGEIALVHFDAHADTGEAQWGHLYGHGTPMRRLIESGAVPGHRFVQIGLRGYWPPPEVVAWMREQRMRCFSMDDVVDRGLDEVVEDAVDHAVAGGARGVFISVDIDVVDPSAAPGTGTPEPGGLSSRELLHTLRRLGRDLEVVGADVVEVAPHYDQPLDLTAALANRLVLELLTGMALRRRDAASAC